MNGAVLHSSRTGEWYTPQKILSAVVEVMGNIDLDPCSNSKESPNVPASLHYTQEDDGLRQEWHGRIFMNPPYGRTVKLWISKLLEEWQAGRLSEAIVLVPGRTDTAWFNQVSEFPWCAIRGRLRFSGHKDAAPFPSAIFYLGDNPGRFKEVFCRFGPIYHREVWHD